MPRTKPIRILLVEDENADARLACQGLPASAGYDVHHVRTARAALDVARTTAFDVVLLDHRLPDLSGMELGRRLRHDGITAPLVLLSGAHQESLVGGVLCSGIEDLVVKDTSFGGRLADAVHSAMGA